MFIYLYAALDACYALTQAAHGTGNTVTHSARIEWIFQKVGIHTPPWTSPNTLNASEVSIARNETFHEALFFGERLGGAVYGGRNASVLSVTGGATGPAEL
jgi:hypothetical protein